MDTREPKFLKRCAELPRDKPMGERTEHANLERPGAQAHPRARGFGHDPVEAWRTALS